MRIEQKRNYRNRYHEVKRPKLNGMGMKSTEWIAFPHTQIWVTSLESVFESKLKTEFKLSRFNSDWVASNSTWYWVASHPDDGQGIPTAHPRQGRAKTRYIVIQLIQLPNGTVSGMGTHHYRLPIGGQGMERVNGESRCGICEMVGIVEKGVSDNKVGSIVEPGQWVTMVGM